MQMLNWSCSFLLQNLFDYGLVLLMCQCVSRLGLTQERIATLLFRLDQAGFARAGR